MKKVVTTRRACMYDYTEDKIVAIFADCYNPELSDRDIFSIVYNPYTMIWVQLPFREELRLKNSNIRIEIINEYADVEQWFDKLKRVILG